MVSSYAMFVKEHIHQFKHLPAKERMKAVAELYHKQKGGMSKAPAKKGGAMTAGKLVRKNKGGDLIPMSNMLGLSLDDDKGGVITAAGLQKKRGRPKKGGAMTAGALVQAPIKSPLVTGSGFTDMLLKGLLSGLN